MCVGMRSKWGSTSKVAPDTHRRHGTIRGPSRRRILPLHPYLRGAHFRRDVPAVHNAWDVAARREDGAQGRGPGVAHGSLRARAGGLRERGEGW